MKQPRVEHHGEAVYSCMLWNAQSGRPIVVTIQDEHQDRWVGRRCVVTASSFEAPLELFMKSDWRRTEPPPAAREPRDDAATSGGAGALLPKRSRGFHP